MTEAYENEWMVRVRAQVMCRDEGTGGWVALGGGGLANVMLGRRPRYLLNVDSNDDSLSRGAHHLTTYEYFIHGKRISDETVVLSCTIKKDFQYNKVMPTFHHWVTEDKRFGLTFQTAADARAFDKGVRTAVQELLEGRGGAWTSLNANEIMNTAPRVDDEENNIFECLNLPSDSRSSSENSTASRPTRRTEQTTILSAINLPANTRSTESLVSKELVLKPKLAAAGAETEKMVYLDENIDADNYPYVHLAGVRDYPYSTIGMIGDEKSKAEKGKDKDAGSMMKRGVLTSAPPTLAEKKPHKPDKFQARIKCRHCHEWYIESANRAGACEFAPDCFRSCIDAVSCIKCAQCMLYHCMSDAEGEFASHPCACAPVDHACATRWLGIGLLSLLVPCLWCYPPLRCIHRAARACRLAGGEHAPRVPGHM